MAAALNENRSETITEGAKTTEQPGSSQMLLKSVAKSARRATVRSDPQNHCETTI